jgi:indolepyruvate ferredoxin oxidoreductase beta subunit
MLRRGGDVFANSQRILPAPVAVGTASYPQEIQEKLRCACPGTHFVDGLTLACEAGHPRTVNTVLLGALSTALDISPAIWREVISGKVPAPFLQENLRAFELGRDSQADASPAMQAAE